MTVTASIVQNVYERVKLKLERSLNDSSFDTALPIINQLRVSNENIPDWWTDNNNLLLAPSGIKIPHIVSHPGLALPENCIFIILSSCAIDVITCWGQDSILLIGNEVHFGSGMLACGPDTTVIIGDGVRCTYNASINARNGGLIYVGPNGLWAGNVTIMTDDMHAIRELDTGKRLNSFGGNVIIGKHVWLGLDALVMDGAVVGHDVVVGARSIVTKRLDSNSIYAGIPTRLVRNNITWTYEDEP